jgi:F0F1-type ATP synthase delta subunit
MIKLAPKLKTKSKDMTVATVTRAAELDAKQFGALETEVHRVDLEERVRRIVTPEGHSAEIRLGELSVNLSGK